MANLRLTLACGPYDRTEALRTGLIQPEGIDLTYVPIQSPPEIFNRLIKKQSFDVSEMSTSVYLQLRSQGVFPYLALPIFPSRLFRHGYIFVNKQAGIEKPSDLTGRRIGVPEYRQTAAVWIRGLLQHEYGVDLHSIQWIEGGVNSPREPDPELDLRPKAGFDVGFIGADRSLSDALRDGELDALIGARRPLSANSHPELVGKLIPNSRQAEQDYFRKTGIFPMMHTVVVREELHRQHSWIAESLFKAFVAAKDWCWDQMRFSGAARYMLPWLFEDILEMEDVLGPDPWPYGLEPNRVALEALNQYLVEQGLMAAPVPLEEAFVPIVLSNE
ncbi:MAG TPA: PhnD/SsuA/transferrin family substrate-binding protein [Chloroflexota bacterium]|nr:PhnD/SsuA/transferrin family substrate-binding protein [Chloroflexota bacterium]